MFRQAVLVIASAASAATLQAQSSSSATVLPVPPGARVRLTAPSLVGPLIANYLEMRGDTVVLVEDRAGQGLWSIPYHEIQTLHLSVGQKNNYGPYIARGAALGGGAGFLIGVLSAATFDPGDSTRKFKRITNGAIAGGIGAALGAIVGSRFLTEAWSPISLGRKVSFLPPGRKVSLLPSRNGATVRVDLQF